MDTISTLTNSIPLLIVTVLGGWLLKDRLDRLEGKLDTKLEARPTREELNVRFGRLEAEVAALRSDLTQIALALGARSRPETG